MSRHKLALLIVLAGFMCLGASGLFLSTAVLEVAALLIVGGTILLAMTKPPFE